MAFKLLLPMTQLQYPEAAKKAPFLSVRAGDITRQYDEAVAEDLVLNPNC